MQTAAALLFLIGLPIAAWLTIRFANGLLMEQIPKFDPNITKTRTDIYSMRAAYASFIVGLLILSVWAIVLAALGLVAGLKILL